MNLHKIIYKLGEKFRNPLINFYYKQLLENDKSTIQHLEELQLTRLKKLLTIAKNSSPYYNLLLQNIDIDSFTLNDLKNIPILTKENLRNNLENIKTYTDTNNLIKSETSGSTGNALIFYRNKEWDATHRAAQQRGYSWYNIKPWDKNIYFWGFNPSFRELIKIRFLDFLLNRYRIFSFSEKELKKSIPKIQKSSYIEGYSSAIFTLSQYMKKHKYSFDNIKMIKGTSEKIYDYYKPTIYTVYGQNFISEYGAAEAGIIAFECPEGNMHITMENVIVEEIDNKIYVTNLFSYSLPIIRYELGDYIVLDKEMKCKCGREHYIIKEVTGRIGKKIYGINSTYPTLTLYYIFKNIALSHNIELAYFGKQYKRGELILEIIENKNISSEKIDTYITKEALKYFKNDVKIKIQIIQKIKSKNAKNKDFESYIEDTNNEK